MAISRDIVILVLADMFSDQLLWKLKVYCEVTLPLPCINNLSLIIFIMYVCVCVCVMMYGD